MSAYLDKDVDALWELCDKLGSKFAEEFGADIRGKCTLGSIAEHIWSHTLLKPIRVHELEVEGRIDAEVVNVYHLPFEHCLKLAEHVCLCIRLGRHPIARPFIGSIAFDAAILLWTHGDKSAVLTFQLHATKGLLNRHDQR